MDPAWTPLHQMRRSTDERWTRLWLLARLYRNSLDVALRKRGSSFDHAMQHLPTTVILARLVFLLSDRPSLEYQLWCPRTERYE